MVGIKIYFIFLLIIFTVSPIGYALNPYNNQGAETPEVISGKEDISSEESYISNMAKENLKDIKEEKAKIMEKVSGEREERKKDLRPFVREYKEVSLSEENVTPKMKASSTFHKKEQPFKKDNKKKNIPFDFMTIIMIILIIGVTFFAVNYFIKTKK